jgi:hypothetical protein
MVKYYTCHPYPPLLVIISLVHGLSPTVSRCIDWPLWKTLLLSFIWFLLNVQIYLSDAGIYFYIQRDI